MRASRWLGKWVNLLTGCFVLAYGVNLTREAGLGLSPWDVLHEGLARVTPLTFGQANIFIGLLLVLASYFMSIKPRAGTVVNMIIVGLFIDMSMSLGWLPKLEVIRELVNIPHLLIRFMFLLVGTTLMGFGSAWYLASNLGSGPRDSLMLGLTKKIGRSVGAIRSFMEITALAIGWTIGGPVGVGTVINAITIGWVIQASLRLFRYLATWPIMKEVLEVPVRGVGGKI